MTTQPTGRLKVVMPESEGEIRLPVNMIDSKTFALVKTALSDEEVEVPAGSYVLSSTLPNGERALAVAEVEPGKAQEVAMHAPTTVEAQLSQPDSGGEARAFQIRLVAYDLKKSRLRQTYSRVKVDRVSQERVELRIEAAPYGTQFAQIATAGAQPLTVALPTHAGTSPRFCRLTVSFEPEIGASVSLAANPRVDAVARYLQSGNLEAAAQIAPDAERLLHRKTIDPFGAALGAYALLRLGALDRMREDWPERFATKFLLGWMADGAIIAGEKAALEGDHLAAISHFIDATKRGLPIFVDGFSMLASRLREYDRAGGPRGISPDAASLVAAHAQRLTSLSPFVDFARITLALRVASLEAALGVPGTDVAAPWRQFNPETKRLEP